MKAFPPPSAKGACRLGFTLTEILVVIGIVLLLAAIVFPIITRVKNIGRQTTCASNLRQIGFSLQNYLQDTHGLYPPTKVYGANCVWAHHLLPYIKNPSLFECPSYPRGTFAAACSEPDESGDGTQWFNGGYQWNDIRPLGHLSLPQNIIRRPAEMVLISDGIASHYGTMTPLGAPAQTVDELGGNGLVPRHGQGVNAFFADNHVKWLSLEKLLDKSLWNYK